METSLKSFFIFPAIFALSLYAYQPAFAGVVPQDPVLTAVNTIQSNLEIVKECNFEKAVQYGGMVAQVAVAEEPAPTQIVVNALPVDDDPSDPVVIAQKQLEQAALTAPPCDANAAHAANSAEAAVSTNATTVEQWNERLSRNKFITGNPETAESADDGSKYLIMK